jgi:hypothetical protein
MYLVSASLHDKGSIIRSEDRSFSRDTNCLHDALPSLWFYCCSDHTPPPDCSDYRHKAGMSPKSDLFTAGALFHWTSSLKSNVLLSGSHHLATVSSRPRLIYTAGACRSPLVSSHQCQLDLYLCLNQLLSLLAAIFRDVISRKDIPFFQPPFRHQGMKGT